MNIIQEINAMVKSAQAIDTKSPYYMSNPFSGIKVPSSLGNAQAKRWAYNKATDAWHKAYAARFAGQPVLNSRMPEAAHGMMRAQVNDFVTQQMNSRRAAGVNPAQKPARPWGRKPTTPTLPLPATKPANVSMSGDAASFM